MANLKDGVAVEHFDSVVSEEQGITVPKVDARENVYELAQKLGKAGESLQIDPTAEKALVRKIDRRLMPILCITYALQYYDKAMLGQAAIFGLTEELDLKKNPLAYSNVSMIFYVGYVIGCYPLSYLAQKYHIARVCAGTCFVWAVVMLSTAGCHSYGAFIANRLCLGIVESGVNPIFMLITSMWYTHKEQITRSGFWFSCSGGANLIAPLVNYGMGSITGGPLEAWQYMYLFAGGITLLWSFVIFIVLPDSPVNASGFTELEKSMILQRIRANNSGVANRKIKPKQVIECFTSATFWGLMLTTILLNVTVGPVVSFGSLIFKGMGFTKFESLLMNMPVGALAVILVNGSAFMGRHLKDARHYIIVAACLVVVMGAALLWQLPTSNRGGRIAGFYLLNFFAVAGIQCIGLATSNVSGFTKKATFAAGFFVSYCIGNIIGPLMFSQHDAPRYNRGFEGVVICLVACAVSALFLRFHLARANKIRERLYGPAGTEHGLEDLTDRENKDFRYLL